MKPFICKFSLTILFLLGSNTVLAEQKDTLPENKLYSKKIKLSTDYILTVHENQDGSITLDLSQYYLIKSIKIGNAAIKNELIKKVNLDRDNKDEYFITVYDRSSTYGAQTNIILWDEGAGWDMLCAPFKRGFIEDENKDGIYEIVDKSEVVDGYPVKKIYHFHKGFFIQEHL